MRRSITFAWTCVLAAAGSGFAQNGDWMLTGRAMHVPGGDPSAVVGSTGSTFDLSSGGGLDLDATLMFNERFGVGLALAGSRHHLRFVGDPPCCGGTLDGDYVWLPAVTVMAQYHHPVYGPWGPYVGLGVVWAEPIYSLSNELEAAGLEELDFDGNPGVAARIGVNYDRDARWYANLDLSYRDIALDVRARLSAEDAEPVSIDMGPWVIGLGFGYRF
jgi:outer membrane protein